MDKKNIAVVSCSVRDGRLSHRVALFVHQYLSRQEGVVCELLDLKQYNFPLFDERLAFQKNPSREVLDYTERFKKADAVIFVTPVYNGSFPASIKNVIDLYFGEWKRKIAGFVSVSNGAVAPIATIQQLQTIMLKLGAIVVPGLCAVTDVDRQFKEDGSPSDMQNADKSIFHMSEETLWLMDKILA